MSKLYGRSDLQSVVNGSHRHDLRKGRHPAGGYGDNDRSLPVLDCADCDGFLRAEGWANNPDKVQRTADEVEYESRARSEGDMYSKLMAQQFGAVLAQQAAQQVKNNK